MIFSRIFKAKWQHKDSNIRISAINDTLDPNAKDDMAILQRLLTNDSNELVRRAVLLKVNDFNLWLSASKDNNNKKIRQYAHQQVENILLGKDSLVLSPEQKLQFIAQQPKGALLDLLLKVEQDDDTVIALYKKLAKPQLITSIFKHKISEKVQLFLVEQVDDQDVLQKLQKHSEHQKVTDRISDKLNRINDSVLKPIKLKKQLQLLLAKFLALKELSDYSTVLLKKQQLHTEWQALKPEMSCLSAAETSGFTDKFSDIENQLTRFFAKKSEAYQQQLIADQLVQDKQAASLKFSSMLSDQAHRLTSAIFENTEINRVEFTAELNNIKAMLVKSVLTELEQQPLVTEIDRLSQQLDKLPEIAESVTEATHLVSKMSQIPLPDKLEQLPEQIAMYEQWLQQWSSVNKTAHGVLPSSIVDAYQQIVTQWTKALKPLKRQQADQFTWVRKKLADVKRLIHTGKYNAAFGVFNKAATAYLELTSEQQQQLSRDHDATKAKIAELSDWEQYIATPRKQKLLERVKALVASPLDNPNEQADQVKQFRKTWNSLGHAEQAVDKVLNAEFNLVCEQAFAPCRMYFAEQEKLRENNYQLRLVIVSDAEKLAEQYSENIDDFKQIDSQVKSLQRRWHNAGDVERQKYRGLNLRFTSSVSPLIEKIRQHHQDNANQKQSLINKAQQISELTDQQQATTEIKKLQQQWKSIGFAGTSDRHLWRKFRAINDDFFAKKKAEHLVEKAEQDNLYKQLSEQLDQLTEQLTVCNDKPNLQNLRQQIEQFVIAVDQANIKPRSFDRQLEKLNSQIQSIASEIDNNQQQQIWLAIFACLHTMSTTNDDVRQSTDFSDLPSVWQKRMIDCHNSQSNGDRASKTLTLEIIAGIDSPPAFKSQRMAVQVALMKQQMSSGDKVTLEQAFIEWLALGSITEQDKDYIHRIKAIFITDV